MSGSSIEVNGVFGKWLAVVMAGLLIAGVAGVWRMNFELGQVFTKVESIEKRLDQIEQIVIYRGPGFGGEGRR